MKPKNLLALFLLVALLPSFKTNAQQVAELRMDDIRWLKWGDMLVRIRGVTQKFSACTG
jgi:hypothetical protein